MEPPSHSKTKIRCIVLIKGIPLRISRQAVPKAEESTTRQFKKQNEASVDSELSLMGVINHPIGGVIPNPCYNTRNLCCGPTRCNSWSWLVELMPTTYDHCTRMILDALDVEKRTAFGE